jgi:ribonuclease VapC
MIVDASAVIAILRAEPEAQEFAQAIADADHVRISTVNYVEAAIVIDSAKDPIASRRFDEAVRVADITIEPVSPRQAALARAAFRDFGKGSGHPARLNFGDCFAYALAKDLDEKLLFKGDDFSRTDVVPA